MTTKRSSSIRETNLIREISSIDKIIKKISKDTGNSYLEVYALVVAYSKICDKHKSIKK